MARRPTTPAPTVKPGDRVRTLTIPTWHEGVIRPGDEFTICEVFPLDSGVYVSILADDGTWWPSAQARNFEVIGGAR